MKKRNRGKIRGMSIPVLMMSVTLSILLVFVSMVTEAETETVEERDVIELESAELLASMDFSGTEGVFNDGNGTTTMFKLTDSEQCTDVLTAKEVRSIGKTYSVVLRVKTNGNTQREQAVFSMRLDSADKSGFDQGLYMGIPGRYNAPTDSDDGSEVFYHKCQNTGTLLSENPVTITRTSTEEVSEILDDQWHTIAIVQDTDNIRYYVDGELYYAPTTAVKMSFPLSRIFGSVEDGTFTAYIDYFNCTKTPAPNSKFIGSMDYYQFYKGALTAEEVASISEKSADETVGIDGVMPKVAPRTTTTEVFTAEEFATYRTEKDEKDRYTQAPTKAGCVFGGWYTDSACTTAVGTTITALSQLDSSKAEVYAKFIPRHVLGVKAQISANLEDDLLEDDAVGAIRFATSVDSLQYNTVGFKFQFYEADGKLPFSSYERESTTVYSKMYQINPKGNITDVDFKTPSQVFASNSKYFMAYSFYNLDREYDYDVSIKVEAFWQTLDGTVVCGEEVVKNINQRRTKDWVYLSDSGEQTTVYGNTVTPYTTLSDALTAVTTQNGVVCILKDYTVADDDLWQAYKDTKHVTVTADETSSDARKKLKFECETLYRADRTTEENFKGVNVKGDTTFSGITLDMPEDTHVYANGYTFKVDEDVTTTTPIQVYGGNHRINPKRSTNITLLGGNYSGVYGGSYLNGVTGSTYVKVAGNANKDMEFATDGTMSVSIYGGSYGSNIAGDTQVIVGGNANQSLDLGNVSQYQYGGAEVFGGCHTKGMVKGNTSVTVEDNAKVTLVGGGGNGTTADNGGTYVLGNANVTVRGNVNAGLDTTLSEKYVMLYGGARYGVVGGGNAAKNDLSEDTPATIHVTVETKDGKTPRFNYIYGGGVYEKSNYDDTTTHAYVTDTNVTINVEDEDTRVCRAVYGGSEKYIDYGDGSIRNTAVVISGGKMLEVIGGSQIIETTKDDETEIITAITGNTDVKLNGGKITGRVHGGCDNTRVTASDKTRIWSTQSLVGGWSSLTIEPEVILSFTETVNANVSKDNHYIIAGSCSSNAEEKSILICNRDTYESCVGKLGSYVDDAVPYKYLVDIMGEGEASFDVASEQIVITPDDADAVTKINGTALEGISNEGTYNSVLSEETIQISFNGIESSEWKLRGIPECTGEDVTLSKVYDCGSIINDFGTSASVKMQFVSNITWAEVTNYATNILGAAGYKKEKVEDTSTGSNRFLRYTKGMKTVYINHFGKSQKAMIILDSNAHTRATEASYTTYTAAGEGTAYYMFGLTKDQLDSGGSGQLLVIRSADNKLIIVDGGVWTNQMELDYERFLTFLREITGKAEGEKIDISAWVITHFHNDHVRGMEGLLKNYGNDLNVERVISNMPKLENVTTEEKATIITKDYSAVKEQIKKLSYMNNDFLDVKVHTGDVIQLADVKLRFLYTHEDSVDKYGTAQTNDDFNNSGIVFMVEAEGMKMLVTGDIATEAETAMLKNYRDQQEVTFKCDIVQTPHHCVNKMNTLYTYAAPEILFFTQSAALIPDGPTLTDTYCDTVKKCNGAKEYFDDMTVGLQYNTETQQIERIYPENYSRSDESNSLGLLDK